jgi:hypothetical protein
MALSSLCQPHPQLAMSSPTRDDMASADVRILIGAMTFIALLVVLLLNDSLDPSMIAPAWLPFPIPLP